MKISGAEAIIRSLIEENVEVIFGYPGGANMPIYDKLEAFKEIIHHVLVRHEQGAAHAAEGYAQIKRKAGVCMATSGPGATNLVTGLADAMMDSQPIVAITGQVVSGVIGTDAFQEADVIGITTPVTKWNYQITKASEIPEIISKAFYIAQTGRPGPVVIDITKDAQFEEFEYKYNKVEKIESYQPTTKANPHQIKKAAELLNRAQRPMILAGHGISIASAQKELKELAEKTNIPVACTLWGLSNISSTSKNYVGMLGMHGNASPNIMTNKADVILAVGMRFDDRVTGNINTYAKQAKIIHIDIDPAELNKNVKVDVPIVADAKQALAMLNKHANKNSHKEWYKQFLLYDRQEDKEVIQKEVYPKKGMIQMGEVINMLSEKTKGKAIIVPDVGQNQMMATRYYKFERDNAIVTSGGLGTMGFGLPAAIGARFADKRSPVIAIAGDGGFQMTIQELATVTQEKLNIKILVMNNHFLGMVRQWQELFFDKNYASTPISSPDFVKVCEAYGIQGNRVKRRQDLNKAMDNWLNSDTSQFLEVLVTPNDNVFPMIPSGASVDQVIFC